MTKNKLFSSLIIAILLFGFCLPTLGNDGLNNSNQTTIDIQVDEAINNSTKEKITPIVEDIKVMTPNSNAEIKKDVIGQTNSTKVAIKKFSYAMLGVLISSLVIYLILSIMNKVALSGGVKDFRAIAKGGVKQEDFESPDNEDEALKIFFEKSK